MNKGFDRKELKHDEFVDTSFRLIQFVEEHPRQIVTVVVGLILVVVVLVGASGWMGARSAESGDLFAQAQAAVIARIDPTGANVQPTDRYQPIFASDEERSAAALERLATAADSGNAGLAQLLMGVELLRAEDLEGAVAALREAEAEVGDDPTLGGAVREALAIALARQGETDEALALFDELAAEESSYPRDLALLGKARLLAQLERTDEALVLLDELSSEFPDSVVGQDASKLRDEID